MSCPRSPLRGQHTHHQLLKFMAAPLWGFAASSRKWLTPSPQPPLTQGCKRLGPPAAKWGELCGAIHAPELQWDRVGTRVQRRPRPCGAPPLPVLCPSLPPEKTPPQSRKQELPCRDLCREPSPRHGPVTRPLSWVPSDDVPSWRVGSGFLAWPAGRFVLLVLVSKSFQANRTLGKVCTESQSWQGSLLPPFPPSRFPPSLPPFRPQEHPFLCPQGP